MKAVESCASKVRKITKKMVSIRYCRCLTCMKLGYLRNEMSDVTYTSKEENTVTRFKAAKGGLRILTGAQADGFPILKAVFVHRSEDPRALNNIQNAILPVC